MSLIIAAKLVIFEHSFCHPIFQLWSAIFSFSVYYFSKFRVGHVAIVHGVFVQYMESVNNNIIICDVSHVIVLLPSPFIQNVSSRNLS